MPNLAGIWSLDLSAEALSQAFGAQLCRVRIPEVPYAEYQEISEGVAVGLLDHGIFENGPQPVEDRSGRKVLFLDGELYNVPELKRRFSACLSSSERTTPEVCLQLIATHGVEIVKYFNGLFCIVLYDRFTQQLTLISDRFGFRPLFYVRRASAFVFGSELKAVCAGDPERRAVDDIGSVELFVYGSHFGDRTWLRDYLRLAPATIMTIERSGVNQRQYWSYKYDETASTLDQPTYYTAFGSLISRAVERSLKGSHRIGLFLSGGYDSRSVAATIPKEYLPLPAFTFGTLESRDVKYAQLIATRLGLEHYALTEDAPYLYSHSRAIVWRTEGMNSFANCTSVRFHPRIKEKADIILLGFLGEFSGSHTWPRLLLARSRRAAQEAIFEHLVNSRIPRIRKIFNPRCFSNAFAALRERFEKSFDTVQNDHPLNIADSWNFSYLQPRGTFQSPAVDRHLFEARAPHMDHDLVDFLLTIPPYSRLEQRVYKKMIAYKFPAIRDVPCTNSGTPVNPHFGQEYTAMAASYLLRKTVAWVTRASQHGEVQSREFRNLGDDFRKEPELVNDILLPLLDVEIFPPTLFNYAGIRELIVEHYEGGGSHEHLLSLLISYGLAMKYFLHDDFDDLPESLQALPQIGEGESRMRSPNVDSR